MFDRPFGLTPADLQSVLRAGGLAPSLHNSQPWAFRVSAESIEIHLDQTRLLSAADSTGAEARMSCGSALFNIRLTLARLGVLAEVTLRSTPDEGPLAVITNGGATTITPEWADLERAIAQRRTNRRPFMDAEVPSELRVALTRAAEKERASLVLLSTPAQTEPLRKLSLQAHRIQSADKDWRAEWSQWTGRDQQPDGVPLRAAGPRPEEIDRWTLRDFGHSETAPDERKVRVAGKDFESEPLIAVLCTYGDEDFTQFQAGQALQRVLLTATHHGLAASFLSQLIEVPHIRADLQTLLGGVNYPQTVLRIGFGGPVPATPRRSVADCLIQDSVGQEGAESVRS